MFCPSCGAEYREGIYQCPDCEVSLVPEPVEIEDNGGKMVPVFRTADQALLPVIKSLLEGTDIPHFIQGDEAVGLLPLGKPGSGFFGDALQAVVLVPEDRAEEAEALLSEELPADALLSEELAGYESEAGTGDGSEDE